MSYIIRNDELIAVVKTMHSGERVEYGFDTVKEALNANYEQCLVNSFSAKISNAKKWAKHDPIGHAKEIRPGHFLVDRYDQV